MNLQDFRQKIPQLNGLSDSDALDVLQKNFYPTVDKQRMADVLGVSLASPEAQSPKGRTAKQTMSDLGITALKGAIGLTEVPVGIADILTGGAAGKKAEELGYRPEEAKAILDAAYSDPQKKAFANVQQADGFMGKLFAAAENPSVIAHTVGESLPSMLAGGVAARGLMGIGGAAVKSAAGGVGPALPGVMARTFGQSAPLVAGAAGEGLVGAGSAAEQIRQQTADGYLTGDQSGLAAASGVATSLFGVLGGKVAQRLGIGDVDTMLAGSARDPVMRKGVVRSFLEGTVTEGALEELPQSISEQVLQNMALGKPLDEGVDHAAALGLFSGGVMGGGAGGLGAIGNKAQAAADAKAQAAAAAQAEADAAAEAIRANKQPGSGPLTNAVNAGTEADAQKVEVAGASAAATIASATDLADAAPSTPSPEGSAEFINPDFQARQQTLAEQMASPENREKVRERFGDDGLNQVLYYAQAAGRADIPAKTADNMLQVAERMMGEVLLQPLGGDAQLGGMVRDHLTLDAPDVAGAQPLGLGLDQTPSGRFTVDAQGNAMPETAVQQTEAELRAESLRDEQKLKDDESAILGQQQTGVRNAPEAPLQPVRRTLTDTNTANMLGTASDPVASLVTQRRLDADAAAQRKDEEDQRRFEQARSGTLLNVPETGVTQRPLSVERGMELVKAKANGRTLLPQDEGFLVALRKEMGDDAYARMAQVAKAPFLFKKQERTAIIKPNQDAIAAWDAANSQAVADSAQQPGDVLNPSGQPFKTKMAADLAAKKTPGAVVPVVGGFVVRPAPAQAAAPTVPPVASAPAPTTPQTQQATPAPEAGPTNQGATNGQEETLLKAEQPTGAAAMVSGAPVAEAGAVSTRKAKNTFDGKALSNLQDKVKPNKMALDEFIASGKQAEFDALLSMRQSYSGAMTDEQTNRFYDLRTERNEAVAAVNNAAKKPSDTTKPESVTQKLLGHAKRLGILVNETTGHISASNGTVNIPPEDREVDGAISRDHVISHEIGHAAMQKRQINYAGFPAKALREQVKNWDELVSASKAHRPDVWAHKNKKIADHARKPNEIIADAIASVLIGNSDFSLLRDLPLTRRDIGLEGTDTTKPGGFIEKAKKADGKVAPAPVAEQQTAAEAPSKKIATNTVDATSKPDGVAGDAASRPTTHTKPVEYVAKLNREIPAKAPDEKPTPDTLKAAASIPTFQGGKTKMARAITEKVRQYWGGNVSKIDTIIDYFGGSGSWGAYMAGAAFPNVKRLVIHEFNPDRLNKIRLFNDRGGDVEKLLSVPEVKALFARIKRVIQEKETYSGFAIANVVERREEYKALIAKANSAIGKETVDGLLQAIQDQGNASFGKYGKGKSGSDAVDDMLRRITSNAGQAYVQMQSLRERGASIEYVTGNSYEAKQTPGKNVLAMVDPPYYATKGYNGVSLVGIDTYNDTRKLLDRLKSAGNSVIYTDEAWWEKHDKNTGRTIVPPDINKQVDGLDAFGQLSSIKGLMGDFFRMPIATRIEVVGFIDGNRNAGTVGFATPTDIGKDAGRDVRQDAGGLGAGTGQQAGGGMAKGNGRVSKGQPSKPGQLKPSTGAGKADARNAALTLVVRNGGNSTAVLTDIAKNSTNPAFKLVAKAILAKGLPFDLRIRTDFTDGKVAHYSTDGHFVEFDPGMPFNLEQVLLHEAVHAVTSKYVASFGDSTPLGKELASLFKLAEQHAKKTGAKFYGLTNADEFLAEVMTNADFAQWLDTVPVPLQKSALSRFVRAVARFFGIQKADGATAQAMGVFERIMLAQSDLQAEASQRLSTSKDAAAVAQAYGVDTEEDGDTVYFGDAEVMLNREDNTYIVASENEFTPDHRAAVAWAENNGFTSELSKSPSSKLTPVESMLRDALEATGDMGAAKDMAYEALRRQGVAVKWQEVVDAAKKMGRGTRASKGAGSESRHADLLRAWLRESGNRDFLRDGILDRRGADKFDYELRSVPVADVTPSQTGDDYLNASSEYTARQIASETIDTIHRREDVMPIILDENLKIIDGNHRHAASTVNGAKTIPALVRTGSGTGKISGVDAWIGADSGIKFSRSNPSSTMPDTITVDGVQRPTTNSNGQLIHPTEQGVRNFWRWFADSKVVDDKGRPLVVYHGTGSDFTEFKVTGTGAATGNTGLYGEGAYFSQSAEYAGKYAVNLGFGDVKNPNIIPAYLSMQNPAFMNLMAGYEADAVQSTKTANALLDAALKDGMGEQVASTLRSYIERKQFASFMIDLYIHYGNGTGVTDLMKRSGFDGALMYGDLGKGRTLVEAVAFDPATVKSATGNSGAFDPKSKDIRFSKAAPQPRTPAATIRAAITKAYGTLLDKLEGKGLVTIAQTEREAIEAAAQARADKTGGDADAIAGRMMSMAGLDVKYSANGNIEGFFDRQTGKSFLVADNLTAASAPGTLMHEVGIHMAADGKLETLFKRAGSLLKTGTQNEFIQRVNARMARAGETSDEEAAAYIVTEYENDRAKAPITIGKWLADLTAAVRAWLFSKGVILKAEQLTVADIAAVARANARSMARGGPNGGPGGGLMFSRAADMAGNAIDKAKQTADKAMGKDFPRAASMPDLNDDQRSLLGKVGASQSPASDAIKAATDRAGLKIRQGMVDRFAALKELDEKALGKDFIGSAITDSAWVLAKMSSAGSGALNAMMKSGRIEMDAQQKVIGLKGAPNGGLTASLQKLGGPAEVERFFAWVAANRAEKLMGEGRENLFTPAEIAAGKTLNTGTTEGGKVRPALYSQVFGEFQQYRDDVLAIAEQAGIINSENRAMWRDEFYVPFYRVMEDDADRGRSGGNGLSRQEAYKKLKGGKQNLNDLMENTLMNFHHLLSASLKNQAAVQAIKNAEHVKIARKLKKVNMGAEADLFMVDGTKTVVSDKKSITFILEKGKKVFYEVDDPLVFESITTLADPGLNNTAVRVMGAFKRLFTNMTTATPQFIIANTFRDLLQASATSPTSKNIAKNLKEGIQSYRDEKTRAEMLASGGAFSFGHIYGMGADEVKASLQKTVAGAGLISSPSMIPSILRKGWDAWGDITDLSENASRAATYAQNVDQMGKLRAAFEARDVMDFSQHGAWPAVRLLVRIVPFLNARLQGLDKLYRSGLKPSILTAMGKGTDTDKQAAARFAMVTGALTLATMALYMLNADDDEYKKLEEWQKDTYWFIRIGENAFFLPKPFEVGAIATIAERTLQQAMDDKATGKLFRERMWEMLMQTFAFNPTPQMFQPLIDVYSNKDAFTGRDIESAGMERMSAGLRSRDTTTAPATALSAISRVFGDKSAIAVSPVQADHLIKGYLGGVGATAAGWIDTMYRAATGQSSPDKAWAEYQPIRRFYRDLDVPVANTRYTTLFYDGLKEANRVYADVMELQKLGRTEEAQALATEKRSVLQMRIALNAQQRRLTEINNRMKEVRRSDKDGEWKRREIDLLTTQKALITERLGKRIEEARATQ